MPIIVNCHQCGKSAKAPDSVAGKKVKCPSCQAILTVPMPEGGGAPAPQPQQNVPPQQPVYPEPAPQPQAPITAAPPPVPVAPQPVAPQPVAPGGYGQEEYYEDDYQPRRRRGERGRGGRKGRGGGGEVDASKKVPAAICGILLGSLGIHKFVLGYSTAGVIMLLVTLLTCGFGGMVMGPIGLIEGILYLTKSDEDFFETYVVNEKQWF